MRRFVLCAAVKLPSHNTVVAYLALFVALGGSAYAATQLPKNSVGTKQIKPNAVTAAKIKGGAVTGAKIAANSVTGANVDESSLSRVPSAAAAERAGAADRAATAENAANAANAKNADNAKALGGVPGSDFLRTNTVQFHTGALNACFKQTLAEVPGWFEITTVGDCKNEFKFVLENLSSETWQFIEDSTLVSLGAGSEVEETGSGNLVHFFAISPSNPSRHALIDCAYQALTAPPRIFCSTRIPPAA